MATNERRLGDLTSIGLAMLKDFEPLGIRSVAQLARQKPESLYEKLCKVTGKSQDVCVLDTFAAAVAQARDPKLPFEQCQWWYWRRKRKAREYRWEIPDSEFRIPDSDSKFKIQNSISSELSSGFKRLEAAFQVKNARLKNP